MDMWFRQNTKRDTPLFFLLLFGLSLFFSLAMGHAEATPPEKYEPRALQALQRMVETYRNLTVLEQRTEFTITTLPLPAADHPFGIPPRPTKNDQNAVPPETPPANPEAPSTDADGKPLPQNVPQTRKLDQKMRLLYSAPNRLRLEVEEKDPLTERVLTSLWVSDGKSFWSYIPDKNWYTREKTPGKMRDFPRLKYLNATSFELLMLMHINPFQEVRKAADSVRYLGEETVRAVVTEVVAMRSSSRQEETELRLYIGKEDGLLHRLINETTPVPAPPSPGRVGDGLDDLIEVRQPPPPVTDPQAPPIETPSARISAQPFRTRLVYDNILKTQPTFAFDTFQFGIPVGALLYGSTEQSGKKRQGLDILREFWKRNHMP